MNSFVDQNNRLPNYVTISGHQIPINDFLPYLGDDVKSTDTQIKTTVSKTPVINGVTYTQIQIDDATDRVNSFIGQNNRLPNYVTISGHQISISDFLAIAGDNVKSVTQTSAGTGTTSLGKGKLNGLEGYAGLETLQSYIYKNLNHQYGASTTAAGVEKTGLGDCWGLSAWTAQVLHDNGYTVRIVQGASVEASNHRWVQVQVNGKWVNFDPSLVTRKYWWGQSYSVTCASVSSIIATYT